MVKSTIAFQSQRRFANMDAPNILMLIRARPATYLGSKSITKLKSFLDGYYFSKHESDPSLSLENSHEDIFWLKFQDWLEDKYQVKSNQSWAVIIRFFSRDDEAALDLFFDLVDEFVYCCSCN